MLCLLLEDNVYLLFQTPISDLMARNSLYRLEGGCSLSLLQTATIKNKIMWLQISVGAFLETLQISVLDNLLIRTFPSLLQNVKNFHGKKSDNRTVDLEVFLKCLSQFRMKRARIQCVVTGICNYMVNGVMQTAWVFLLLLCFLAVCIFKAFFQKDYLNRINRLHLIVMTIF